MSITGGSCDYSCRCSCHGKRQRKRAAKPAAASGMDATTELMDTAPAVAAGMQDATNAGAVMTPGLLEYGEQGAGSFEKGHTGITPSGDAVVDSDSADSHHRGRHEEWACNYETVGRAREVSTLPTGSWKPEKTVERLFAGPTQKKASTNTPHLPNEFSCSSSDVDWRADKAAKYAQAGALQCRNRKRESTGSTLDCKQ